MKKSIFFYAALVAVALCTVSCSDNDDDDPITYKNVVIPEPETAKQAIAFEIPAAQQPTVDATGEKLESVNISESAKAVLRLNTTDGIKYLTYDSKYDEATKIYTLTKGTKKAGTIQVKTVVAASALRRVSADLGNIIIKLDAIEYVKDNGEMVSVSLPTTTVTEAIAPSNPKPAEGQNLNNIARTWVVTNIAMTLDGDVDCTVLEEGNDLKELATKAQENDAQLTESEFKQLCRSVVGITFDKTGQFSIEYANFKGQVLYFYNQTEKAQGKTKYIECDGKVDTEACTWNWINGSDQTMLTVATKGSNFDNKFINDDSVIGVKFYDTGIAHVTIATHITGSKNYNAIVDFTLK